MSPSREGPNPLRPYYVPPSVGKANSSVPITSTSSSIGSKYGSTQPASSPSFGSSARNILADMDYSEYLSDPSPSSTATVRTVAEQAIWKYTSVFLAQPFEVAKTVLQVRAPGVEQSGSTKPSPIYEARRRPIQLRGDDPYRDYEVQDTFHPKSNLSANVFPRVHLTQITTRPLTSPLPLLWSIHQLVNRELRGDEALQLLTRFLSMPPQKLRRHMRNLRLIP